MRIRGLFLRSHIARRVFWVLLLAALLPLTAFALLGHQTYNARAASQQLRATTDQLKFTGLRLADRLVAARTALAGHAGGADWLQPSPADGEVQTMLARVATVTAGGSLRGGDAEVAAAWSSFLAADPANPRSLLWQAATAAEPARVWVRHLDARHRGWWLAEVAPEYLWADFAADGAAAEVCVRDRRGQPLNCPQPDRDTEGAPSWPLFMAALFGSPDWHLSTPVAAAAGNDRLPRLAGMGLLATLLLIAMLALVMIRRTMVPLERLLRGTHRLAAGDWSTRVADGRRDEFGQLAEAFDAMAERIGRQMQSIEVQSAIDREILDGLNVDNVMKRVAQRLQSLVPTAQAAVLARRGHEAGWVAYNAEGLCTGVVTTPPVAATADGVVQQAPQRLEAELAVALRWPPEQPASLGCAAARWAGSGDDVVAWLLLAAPLPLALDEDALRELSDLRDRVAVTLAAAARERHLRERAERDALTGMLNRHGLHDACDQALAAGAAAAPFSLLLMDLDGFKEVNDTLGHQVGDELLRAVGDRVRQATPPDAVLARPGGDEFVVLLPGAPTAAAELAGALCGLIAHPFPLRGQTVHLGASIGVASCPGDADTRDELLRRADLAMYAAKAQGRGRWLPYGDSLDARASERAWIVRDLRTALDTGGLEVHYQPRVDLRDGRIGSAEALVRWPHPQRGMVPPVQFIPIAEDAALIAPLGNFVLDTALRNKRAWRDAGLAVGRVAVNVSARQLEDPEFARRTLQALARHDLSPQDLEIEITESLCAGNTDTVRRALDPLRRLGVLVALDDFGTGYSSLSALQHLPVDVLKIDRSFVTELGERESAAAIVRSIIALARALEKRVVAEGVETELQEQQLLLLGCDEFQGYRYAKPLPSAAFAQQALLGFGARAAAEPRSAIAAP